MRNCVKEWFDSLERPATDAEASTGVLVLSESHWRAKRANGRVEWYPDRYTARFSNLLGHKGEVRTLDLENPYFLEWRKKNLNLAWGERPAALAGTMPLTARQLAAYRKHASRVSPLEIARRYQAEVDRPGLRTKIQAAQRLGISYVRMLQALSLLKLDRRVIEFLDAHYSEPIIAAAFSEKRLRVMLTTAGPDEQWPKFQAMLEEVRSKPSVWGAIEERRAEKH